MDGYLKKEEKMASPKWANPFEWLEYKVNSGDWSDDCIRSEFLDLARQTDPDVLQDRHQEEMDNDGYFKQERLTLNTGGENVHNDQFQN